MEFLRKIFKGNAKKAAAPQPTAPQQTVSVEEISVTERRCYCTPMELFRTLPEVFWAIDFIASRIAGAKFVVKRTKDDSVVWGGRKVCEMLVRPNCLMGWSEFVYTHFVYKLADGNAYVKAAMGPAGKNLPKHKYCSNFWPLPAEKVRAHAPAGRVPIFGIAAADEIVESYSIRDSLRAEQQTVPAWQVWHDRDGAIASISSGYGYLKSMSRLESVLKPIANLLAVYEARNVIYTKRGGIGFIVSLKQDDTGTVAMTPEEKEDLLKQTDSKYGVTDGRSPYGISNIPLSFVRTNMSISELQPFEETLADAIEIAGAYGIPAVLVPRKDQSTFSNQSTAEKAVYCGVIIPMAKRFCEDLSEWLGLNDSNIYIDCDFSGVDCLQVGLKEAEQVKKLVNDRCQSQFMSGLITLNDWRAQIHESQIEEEEMPLFSKLRWQMTPDELAKVDEIMKTATNNNTNPKTSTDDEGQREEEEPGVPNQGEQR